MNNLPYQIRPYWWQTVVPFGDNGGLFEPTAHPNDGWAKSATGGTGGILDGASLGEPRGIFGEMPLGGHGGMLGQLAEPTEPPLSEQNGIAALNAPRTPGADWLAMAASKLFEPITSYPETYAQMNREAREQVAHGIGQLEHLYQAGVLDPITIIKGLGNVGLGSLGYVASPISAGLRTAWGKPVEDLTGIPKEYSEFALSLGIPGLGLRPAFPATPAMAKSRFGKRASETSPPGYSFYDPPMKPQRPFEADYPHGARADPTGKLLETMEGTPITGRNVAGRRELGGPDVGLTDAQFDDAIKRLTGRRPRRADLRSEGFGKALGATAPEGDHYRVYIDRTLNPRDAGRVAGHEMGHTVHDTARAPLPPPGALIELAENYSTLTSGREGLRPQKTPRHFGYHPYAMIPEAVAEGVRAYATNPNYFKTVAPEAAAWIRAWANSHPQIRKAIQFNALAGLIASGVGSRPWVLPPPSPSTMRKE